MGARGLLSLALPLVLACACPVSAQEESSCAEDAMLVFDASRSMAASDASNAGLRRIDSVRTALARILPRVAPRRRLGLITYGPGAEPACAGTTLELLPMLNAADRILDRVNGLNPGGRTPLTRAVEMAADLLNYRARPATIVLLTDGEETCGGAPCALARVLKAHGAGVTVHIVSYRIADSLGSDAIFQARCLADETGGLYVATETADELAAALEKVLACPLVSRARPANELMSRRAASGP
jgi:Ca-activated chloride channel family protein